MIREQVIETCVNCKWFSSCDDVTENCENEGCTCFELLED